MPTWSCRAALIMPRLQRRLCSRCAFDKGYPDYAPSSAAASWIAQARQMGFHIGVHVNVGSIDRSNTALLQQMQPGLLQVGTDAQGNPIWDGTVNNAYVSSAYQPW